MILLIHHRAGLGDAALDQIGLNLKLLVRTQVDHGVERQIAGKCDPDCMPSRREQHGFSYAVELIHVSRELIVHKNRRPGGRGGDFQLSRGFLGRGVRRPYQRDIDQAGLSGLEDDLLGVVLYQAWRTMMSCFPGNKIIFFSPVNSFTEPTYCPSTQTPAVFSALVWPRNLVQIERDPRRAPCQPQP